MTTYDLATVESDLLDYSDFEEVGSVSRAKSYITAANRWLTIVAASASNQGSSLTRNVQQVMQMLARAQSFVASRDTASANKSKVRFFGISQGFR